MPTIHTKTLGVKKENSLLKDGATAKGNGADRHMPLGRTASGDIYRGLMKFSLDWANVYQIVQAVLVVKATQESHVTFGAGPTIAIRRVGQYWMPSGGSEGTWATNGSIYPGPSVTGSVYTGGPWGTATGVHRRIDITTLVDQWAPSSVLMSTGAAGGNQPNHGIRLKAPDESTTGDRYEIHGMRASYVGQQPHIELRYISNKPPNVPTVWSPAEGSPAIVASRYADTLTLDFTFSDDNPADVCSAYYLAIHNASATDGTPGSPVLATAGAPTALGGVRQYRATIVNSGAAFLARSPYRYRLATMDNEGTWGTYTSLADGHFQTGYQVFGPGQLYMDPLTEEPHLRGSLVSYDPNDYIVAVEPEVYRDTAAGSVALWAPGPIGQGGTATAADLEYEGATLHNLETVRWRMRLYNRDEIAGDWSPWQYTTVYATTGPDNCSPANIGTKLTTRTPDLTIAHSAAFDGYRWRVYRDGAVIHDSGETAMTSGTTVDVTVPDDLLSWGDGSDEDIPLEWDAQIKVTAVGEYGDFTQKMGIRVNALPGCTLELETELASGGYLDDSTPDFNLYYEDVDQESYDEWPRAYELEVRESTTTGGQYPAHDGTLLTSQARRDADVTFPTAGGTRIGITLATAMTVDTEYEFRARFSDDADAIATTTLAANSSATDDNIKVTSVTGMEVGQVIEIDTGADYEVRTIETVGTAGAGGTGIDLNEGLENAHTSGDTVAVRYWGGWSETLLATYHAAPTASPSSPADAATVYDPAQTLDWTLSITQASAIVRLYERVSSIDLLIWEATVDDSTTEYDLPILLLEDGTTYAWEVDSYDTYGLYDTTTRRTFTTDFTAPAQPAEMIAETDPKESSVSLSWARDFATKLSEAGPASHWRLGEASGTLADETGLLDSASETGIAYAATGLLDPYDTDDAITFSGASDEVTFGTGTTHEYDGTAPFTLVGLIEFNGNPGADAVLLSKLGTQGWYLRADADRTLEFGRVDGSGSDTVEPTDVLSTGTTYLVVARYDTENMSLWLDGVQIGSDTESTRDLPASHSATLRMGGTSVDLNATMDEWAIFDRALTDDEIELLQTCRTESVETYFDHYEVWWQEHDGGWKRIDEGPESLNDGATKLTEASLVHYGGRYGENEYMVTASNGAQTSDPAYVTAELDPAISGWWSIVVPDETRYTTPIRVTSARRRSQPIVERFDPPGRGASVHHSWGAGPRSVVLTMMGRPTEDGDLSAAFEAIQDDDLEVYVKAPSGWQWDPVLARVTDVNEQPQTGGMLSLSVTFERTDG